LRSTGKRLVIGITPELRAALDAIPKGKRADGVLTFIVNEYGMPFASAATFGSRFGDWCRMAGLKPVMCDDGRVRSYRAHGLRKAACRQLAHAGCTAPEIMAVSGHATLAQVQVYIDEVEQGRMAAAAMTKLANSTRTP
jgi:integrase